MSNKKIILLLNVLFILLFVNVSFSKENKILFKVNNDIVTSLDILNEINYLRIINKDILDNTAENEIYEIAKNSLLREKIKEIELLNHVKKIQIEEEYLDQILLNYFKKYNVNSKKGFEEFFSKVGLEPESIEKKITIEVMWNQLIYEKFFKNVKIDKDKIRKKILSSNKINEYLLSEIVFNVDQSENLDEKYSKIKNNIINSSFSETALLFSISVSANNGGDLGWLTETSIDKKILKELISIDIGEFTNPILIPGGFLILKINDKRISEVKKDEKKEFDLIVRKMTNDQLNQFSNVYYNKIKKNIQVNEF